MSLDPPGFRAFVHPHLPLLLPADSPHRPAIEATDTAADEPALETSLSAADRPALKTSLPATDPAAHVAAQQSAVPLPHAAGDSPGPSPSSALQFPRLTLLTPTPALPLLQPSGQPTSAPAAKTAVLALSLSSTATAGVAVGGALAVLLLLAVYWYRPSFLFNKKHSRGRKKRVAAGLYDEESKEGRQDFYFVVSDTRGPSPAALVLPPIDPLRSYARNA